MPPPPKPPKALTPRQLRRAAIHADVPDGQVPGGLAGQLVVFTEELRGEGMAVGTSELIDATVALGAVGWGDREAFRETLSATLAKSPEDRHVFELVFDRFFFRAAELEAVRHASGAPDEDAEQSGDQETGGDGEGVDGDQAGDGDGGPPDLDAVRDLIARAIADGASGQMGDLASLAIGSVGGHVNDTGVVGVDVQRIRRALDLKPDADPEAPEDDPRRKGLPREGIREFEQALRRELERRRIERLGELPPARALNQMDRALPTGAGQSLADIHRVVRQLKRRLNTQGHELRGQRRRTQVDLRATMRASLQTGGVPVVVKERAIRPRRPEIYVLCDVSTSVTSASLFFLSVLHALHDAFRKMRSFVFVERISEVTELFEREREFEKVSQAIGRDAGVADVTGYTDYGRVWREFLEQTQDDLNPRSTVIVLGDARTNGRDPAEAAFAQIADRAGRAFWLNPEPALYWDYGDSVISRYAPYCEVHECWTSDQLEAFVTALTTSAVTGQR
ncbi:VWA domain-containing protein [Patulibacter sp.]|uniref:VWA domain-containing protein n=1 Tax=Patulibacter sp. TaxID=1912859 RepID=UPI0027197430|nr:VWA domain-containing protein [Patulibacter sp.]MDO9410696.1 VWA domain-containing protein [Patulibacter sp.]